MTRLVDDEAYTILLRQLSLIDRMVDVVATEGARYIHEAIDAARSTVNRWPVVAPVCAGSVAKRELIQADIIGECGDHGLFWDDSLGREVTEKDCPQCAYARAHAVEIDKQARVDSAVDAELEKEAVNG
jgi:hypothetical protein